MADLSINDRQLRAEAMLRTHSAGQDQTPRELVTAAIADLLFYAESEIPHEILTAGIQDYSSQLARDDPTPVTGAEAYTIFASRMVDELLYEANRINGTNAEGVLRETRHSSLLDTREDLEEGTVLDVDDIDFSRVRESVQAYNDHIAKQRADGAVYTAAWEDYVYGRPSASPAAQRFFEHWNSQPSYRQAAEDMRQALKAAGQSIIPAPDPVQVAQAVADGVDGVSSAVALSFPASAAQRLAHSQQSAASGSGDELQRPANPALGGRSAQGETGR